MQRECTYFMTDENQCLCGETTFACNMYQTDIFCSHRIYIWEQTHRDPDHPFRIVPPPVVVPDNNHLIVQKEWTDCQLKLELVSRAAYNPTNPTRQWDIDRLVKKIAKDAHVSRKQTEIRAFVEDTCNDDSDEFALGESSSFWEVHRMGVQQFRHNR
jgi:hypothetical protein